VLRYVVGRVLQMVPVLFGVSIIVFLLVRLIPGNPAVAVLGGRATPALIAQVNRQLRLNEPIYEQYFHYVSGWLRGDFGTSFFYGSSVWSLTIPRIPVTFELLAYAALVALLITFPIASIAASNRDRWPDYIIRVVFTTTLGMPSFWLGLVLSLYLGVHVHLFPVVGGGSGVADRLYHLTLPALTIALAITPLLVRALRSSLIEVLSADFVRTARAAGLRRRYVMWSYILRNSVLPLVTVLSINLGWLIGGTVIVEQVFGIPGIGSLLLGSITTRDYAIIQLVTMILALTVLVVNLMTDLVYAWLDPRVDFRA
jgi:peptide/nickel transport system permease protein